MRLYTTTQGGLVGVIQGPKGDGLKIDQTVGTYAELPSTLDSGDAGYSVFNTEDSLIYIWSGTAWPAEGSGVDLRGPPGAGLSDGDKGDITVSGSGTVLTVDSGLSADKLADGTTNKAYTATEKSKLAGVAVSATANDTNASLRDRATHTGSQTSATISDFQEAAQDAVNALLAAGTNVSLSYNDAGNSLTITSTGGGGGLDAEAVRDAIGIALIGAGVISVIVNDAADTITISSTATANATDAALRDRGTHTGSQTASTISNFSAAVDARVPVWMHALPTKTTPVSADEILLCNSQSSFAASRMTYGNFITAIGGGTPADGSVTITKLAAALLVTQSEGIAANDNDTTIATCAAVKAFVESVTSASGGLKTIADYVGPDSPNPGQPALNTAGGNWTFAMNAMAKDTHGNGVGVGGDVGYVMLPEGKGVFDGWDSTVLGYTNLTVHGGGPWATMLTLNAPLIDTTAVTLGELSVQGIGCFKGTAADFIKVGAATDNGGRFRLIHHCEFWNYTARAIGVTGSDTPYFDIRWCTFAGGVGGVGIYAAGFTDSWVVDHNEFRAYKGGMHFDGLMSRMTISNNNFMHVSDSNTGQRYDVFFSASISPSTAKGQGVTLINNWHGPEGRSNSGVAGDLYIVIADRSGTAPNFTPNLGADSIEDIHGLIIQNSTCFDMGTTPYVYSTTDSLRYCEFGKGCTRYGATGAPTLTLRSGNVWHNSNLVVPFADEFTPAGRVQVSTTGFPAWMNFWKGTEAEYAAIATKDANTIYLRTP